MRCSIFQPVSSSKEQTSPQYISLPRRSRYQLIHCSWSEMVMLVILHNRGRTTKRLCVTNVTGLLLESFVVLILHFMFMFNLMFSSLLQNDLFKGRWSLVESFSKQNHCHICHARFAIFVPLPSSCISSLLLSPGQTVFVSFYLLFHAHCLVKFLSVWINWPFWYIQKKKTTYRVRVKFHCHVIFMCVNKIKVMYEGPCVNVKVELGSSFIFTSNLPYMTSILFVHVKFHAYARKNYVTVEIQYSFCPSCHQLCCSLPYWITCIDCEHWIYINKKENITVQVPVSM